MAGRDVARVKPSIGRIVHYVSYGTPGGEYGKECRAAIVTETRDDFAGLCVLNPAGQFFNRSIPHDEGPPGDSGTNLCGAKDFDGGTWHWPEREPAENSPKISVSADLSAVQMKQVTEAIQAAILQQAKRGRTTALKLPGRS